MNKIAIVTGASRGIGREIAKLLARNNIKVIANYNHSEKEAIELKKELEKDMKRIKEENKLILPNSVHLLVMLQLQKQWFRQHIHHQNTKGMQKISSKKESLFPIV